SRATRCASRTTSGPIVASVVTSRPGAGPRSSSSAIATVRAIQAGSSGRSTTADDDAEAGWCAGVWVTGPRYRGAGRLRGHRSVVRRCREPEHRLERRRARLVRETRHLDADVPQVPRLGVVPRDLLGALLVP